MKRIGWIDTTKGILIILVVLGHSHVNRIFDILINSFHMSAFFLLAGITFHLKGDYKKFVLKKIKALIVPYLAFAAIMLIYEFFKSSILSQGSFNLFSGLVSVFLPISGRNSTTTYGLWFLPCLFLVEVLVYSILKIYERKNSYGIIVTLIIYAVSIVSYKITNVASVISILPFAITFVLLGHFLQKYLILLDEKRVVFLPVSIFGWIIATLFNYYWCNYVFDLSSMSVGNALLYIISGFFGSIVIIYVAKIFSKSKLLQKFGRDSIYYYGLHYEILGGLKIFSGVLPYKILYMPIVFALLYPMILIYKSLKERIKWKTSH